MTTTYTYEEIMERFGKETADAALESIAEPTNRLMYPAFEDPNHIGKVEYAGDAIKDGNYLIRAFYYLTPEEEDSIDFFDWSNNVEFQVEELL